MFPGVHVWLRNAAAVIFSTAIGFLVIGLIWQFCRELAPKLTVFASIGSLSILVAAIYTSLTVVAELNWNAMSGGCSIGIAAMGSWSLAQPALLSPVPHTLLIPLGLSTLTVAATVGRFPFRERPSVFNTSRFVSVVHLLQGVFLFAIVLPSSI